MAKKVEGSETLGGEGSFGSLNLYQRILKIQDECAVVVKDTDVGFKGVKYKGVSHDSVVRTVRDVAIRNGVLIMPSVTKWEDIGNRYNVEITTTFTNVDNPSEQVHIVSVGQGMDSQDKASGKAQSYAKKYGLMLALQLETADGDETRGEAEYGIDTSYLERLLETSTVTAKQLCDHFGVDALSKLTTAQYAQALRYVKTSK